MTQLWVGFLAILLPWAVGTTLLFALDPRLSRRDMAYALSHGYVIGVLIAAFLFSVQLKWLAAVSPWPVVAVLAAVAIGSGWRLRERLRAGPELKETQPEVKSRWWYFFVVLIGVKASLLAYEALRQPIVSWDAWTTWLLRSRIWLETGGYVEFADTPTVLASASGYAIEAWRYPELVSWIGAWSSAWSGTWVESSAVLPWVGLVAVLPLGMYSGLRRSGVGATVAIVAAWALLSLPLVGTHIAMTGYADIWLATSLMLAVMSAFRWLRTHHYADLLVTMLMVIFAAAIKPEGLVWAGIFVLTYIIARLGSRVFMVSVLVAALAMLGLFQLEGVRLTLPLLGSLSFGWPVSISELSWHLWVYGNWHLLFWILPLALFGASLSMGGFYSDRARLGLLSWVIFSLGGFLFLFLWTDSAEWARLGTANNRVMLQLAPSFVFWLAIEYTEHPLIGRFSRPIF